MSTVPIVRRIGARAGAAVPLMLAMPALAGDASHVDKGDTAWMLVATALVLLMAVPGLAMFYGGLVRTKNALSIHVQIFAGFSLVTLLWVTFGYSLAFTAPDAASLAPFIGGWSKAFLAGVTPTDATAPAFASVATFSKGVALPEIVYVAFQLAFAGITPVLIVGAFAERMRFSAVLAFMALWFTFAYLPLAHMVWFWAGPDAYTLSPSNLPLLSSVLGESEARRHLAELAAAGTDRERGAAVLARFADAVNATGGFLFAKGALDFAGGTVVHINAGIAGLVAAMMLGRRVGYGREHMAPHNLTMTMIGVGLLWFGWIGFNAGSALEANGIAGLALINTIVAPAAGGLAWLVAEWAFRSHPSALGLASGAVAGLVAVTPAAGFVGPMGALVIGAAAGLACYLAVTHLKARLGYDDSLDVFGVHGVGGIVGAILTGVFNNPALGGTGAASYAATDGSVGIVAYDMVRAVGAQLWAVGVSAAVSAGVTAAALTLIGATLGLRVSEQAEREGLDVATHGERAYS